MSSPQGNALNFPFFFSPPPPFRAPPPPPPAPTKLFSPPPPPHSSPPPPQPFSPLPRSTPPPPLSPPPHVLSPPPPISPFPAPDNPHGAVIIIVFVSLGGLLFLAFAMAGLCCFIKKSKKKKKSSQEVEILSVDRHFKVKELIEKDSHGKEEVAITFEEDDHVEEKIMKNEDFNKAYGHQRADGIESGTTSNIPYHQHHPHKV